MSKKKTRRMWTDKEKETLITRYQQDGGTSAWLETRGVNPAWFYKMRRQYLAAHPGFNPNAVDAPKSEPVSAVKPPTKSTEYMGRTFTDADIAEYQALEHGHKSAWLQAHGLNHQSVFEVRKRLGITPVRPSRNGSAPAASVRDLLPSVRVAPAAYRVPPKNVPISIPPGPSLDETICALEVMMDHYRELIDKMKAMRGVR